MNWKRTIGLALAGLVALLILAGLAGYFYLRSNSFRQYALSKIVQQADLATGGHTQIGGLDFSLSTLTAHLYNITLRGTEGPEQPPLLRADELTVRLKIVSALHRQVNLRELLIDHPVVYVQVGRDGKNNLPAAPPSQNSSHTSVFDLAVGHVQLNNGEVNYNDRKTPIDADLYDLGTDIRFESLAKRYEGVISYDNGHVKYAHYAALPHNLKMKFTATPERLNLDSALLNLGSSNVTLHASVSDYSNPVADGGYQIHIHTQDFAAMSPQAAPAGDIALTGQLHYRAVGNEPLLRNISLNGKVASDALSAVASGNRVELRRLQGTYQLANGNLEIKNLAVDSLGGSITANADIKHLDTTQDSHLQAVLHNISLGALQRALHTQGISGASVSGAVGGKVKAAWQGSMANLRAHSDLSVQAIASSKSNSGQGSVPVNGAIHAAYDGARETISLRDTTLRIPSATLTAQGTISNHSSLQLKIAATNLHQLAVLATSFGSPQSRVPAVSGSATLNAVVSGSMKQAHCSRSNSMRRTCKWKAASGRRQACRCAPILRNSACRAALSSAPSRDAPPSAPMSPYTIGLTRTRILSKRI